MGTNLSFIFTILILFLASCSSPAPAEINSSQTVEPKQGSNSESNITLFIGEDIRGEKVQGFLDNLGIAPEISRFSDLTYYTFPSKGIELFFGPDNKIQALILHAEGSDDYRQFKGDLPYGITFLMKLSEVEELLGTSDVIGGNGNTSYWVYYKEKGISITYDTLRVNDPESFIHHIIIQKQIP